MLLRVMFSVVAIFAIGSMRLVHAQSSTPTENAAALACTPKVTQGGIVVCRTEPGALLKLNGEASARSDSDGVAVLGLSRTAKSPVRIEIDGRKAPAFETVVLPRTDKVSRFTMACGKISAQTPEQKRHAEESWVKKEKALKLFHEPLAPMALVKPADGPYSSPFGAVRTYVPETKDCEGRTNVHNGLDIAIGTGTEIRAPMAGTVILADPDLYYEGGAVFLDHGRGLVSVMMHMSRIDVKAGDVIQQNQPIGLSGATGRVTGPHLHWAIKFRNVASTDRATDIWLDPALVLQAAMPPSASP